MKMENIIKLIKTVSESSLTSFKYTEGDSSLSMEIIRGGTNNLSTEVLFTPQASEEKTTEKDKETGTKTIKSPMVGTFYAAKSEDSEPFISVGDVIKKGQIIGIIEAMKIMNEIESAYDGYVEAILVKNKDMVEYGQPLVTIKPL
jgi:acetyl-CoA carboxylase biotin carboxyl carrier protein